MTTELVVSSGTQKRFLETAIEYGIAHNILSDERRRELATHAMTAHRHVCSVLKYNTSSMGESMSAARTVARLLSIGLEARSGRDVATAARILGSIELHLVVHEMIERIEQLRVRFVRFMSVQKGDYILSHAQREVMIFFTHHFVELEEEKFDVAQLYSIKTLTELTEREHTMKTYERELAVSKAYLPWKQMLKEAGLYQNTQTSSLMVLPHILDQLQRELNWNVGTLCTTLYASYLTAGTFSTVISWNDAMRFIPCLSDEGFKERMIACGDEYAKRYAVEMNDADTETFRTIWKCATQDLLAHLPEEDKRSEIDEWFGKMHIMISAEEFEKDLDRKYNNTFSFGKSEKVLPISLSRILQGANTNEKRRAILKNMDWDVTVLPDEMSGVLLYFSPPEVIAEIPLTFPLIASLLGESESFSQSDFLLLLNRLCKKASRSFWMECTDDVLGELSLHTTPKSINFIPMEPRFLEALSLEWERVAADRTFKDRDITRLIKHIVKNAHDAFWAECSSEFKARLYDLAPESLKLHIGK